MMPIRLAFCGLLFVLPMELSAADAPSYGKHVHPFFAKYCLECHSGKDAKGVLDLSTYKGLFAGGDHGSVVTPGKPDESRLVRMIEGKGKPLMPPKKARQPAATEIALVRAWIEGGARDDGKTAVVVLPEVQPRDPRPAPVSALAYRPDGKLLAAGGNGVVHLIDPHSGEFLGKLSGQTERVTALAFSADGRILAAASGKVGASGEVRLYRDQGEPRTIAAHQDLIYGLAFSPDGKLLATAGYDRVIHLWDATTGKRVKDLRDHSDAVYAVAFSPDGKLLASGSADRAVKIWDVATGTRLHTLSEATDWVYTLAWHPQGGQLAAAGVDKSIRVWDVSPQGGKIARSVFAHEGPVLCIAYSADGKTLYSLGEDRVVKAWDAARMVERRVYPRQPDTVLSLAVRPNQKQIAIGRFDGVLKLLEETTGKVEAELLLAQAKLPFKDQPPVAPGLSVRWLPPRPKQPALTKLTPASGAQGQTLTLRLEGENLEGAEVLTTIPSAIIKVAGTGEVQLKIPPRTPAGVYQLSVRNAMKQTATRPFMVDRFPVVEGAGLACLATYRPENPSSRHGRRQDRSSRRRGFRSLRRQSGR